MHAELTRHAKTRQQQRNIPPLITEWLIRYGDNTYLGRGTKALFFTKKKVRQLEKAVGKEPVRRLAEFLSCYLIVDVEHQKIITMAKRFDKTRFLKKVAIRGRSNKHAQRQNIHFLH